MYGTLLYSKHSPDEGASLFVPLAAFAQCVSTIQGNEDNVAPFPSPLCHIGH